MKMSAAIAAAYEKKWSMINTFNVKFDINNTNTAILIGGQFPDDINLHIKNFTTSDRTNTPIETFLNNQWFIHNGRDELYRFNATFRDHNNLALYRKFSLLYQETKDWYFDEVAMTVRVFKEPDWYISDNEEDLNGVEILVYEGVLVEGISNISFSNETENEIAEFSVNFKAVNYKVITK